MALSESILRIKKQMRAEGIEPERGLGQELFLFASTLMPVVNVDLVIFNEKGQVLLSWRDDPHCGKGWHIPGGCVRIGESFSDRIDKTALSEIGQSVVHDPHPAWVFEIFSGTVREGIADQRERSHFVTLAFICRLPEPDAVRVVDEASGPGDLKWFSGLPKELLPVQECYRKDWIEITKNMRRN